VLGSDTNSIMTH